MQKTWQRNGSLSLDSVRKGECPGKRPKTLWKSHTRVLMGSLFLFLPYGRRGLVCCSFLLSGKAQRQLCNPERKRGRDSYLVDPASSHMLVSKIKPCMSKYKHLYCETANGSLNQLSFIWLYHYYLDNRSNSRANTCEKSRLLEGMYLLD